MHPSISTAGRLGGEPVPEALGRVAGWRAGAAHHRQHPLHPHPFDRDGDEAAGFEVGFERQPRDQVFFLLVIGGATAIHWLRHPERARAHASDPAMAPFYGAVPMAILTVGSGALLVGRELIGLDAAVVADSVLWGLGTAIGLAVSVVIPTLMIVRHRLDPRRTLATWLMPVVPPLVSAASGATLIPHLPSEGRGGRCCSPAWRCSASVSRSRR